MFIFSCEDSSESDTSEYPRISQMHTFSVVVLNDWQLSMSYTSQYSRKRQLNVKILTPTALYCSDNDDKPVGELVCALRGFPWTVTICDKWHRRPHDHKFRNICCPEIWSFEIFQDGGRPNLAFGTTGSRSIQSAVPENPTLGSNTKSIRRPVPEIWPLEIIQDGGLDDVTRPGSKIREEELFPPGRGPSC